MQFLITDLGIEDVILGYPWLSTFEPQFSWKDGAIDTTLLPVVIRSPDWHTLVLRPTIRSTRIGWMVTEEAKQKIVDILTGESQIGSIATDLAIKAKQYTKKVKVLEKYQRHHHVFSEEAAQRFPPKRPWNHAIDLKPDTPNIIDCKVYPLTQEEDKVLVAFLEEQLKKGYIVPSISPYASPFFFVKKKDSKLQLVRDYWKLNEYTIRNWYPLPFIPDLISQVQDAYIFTKFDVRWGIITSGSKQEMKRKRHLRPNMVFLNQGSCSLVWLIHWVPSRPWWIKSSRISNSASLRREPVSLSTWTTSWLLHQPPYKPIWMPFMQYWTCYANMTSISNRRNVSGRLLPLITWG